MALSPFLSENCRSTLRFRIPHRAISTPQIRAICFSSVFDETRCNLFFPTEDDDDDDEQDIEDEDEDMEEEEEFGDGPEYPAEASVVPKKMLRQVSYAGQVDVVDVAATTTFAYGEVNVQPFLSKK